METVEEGIRHATRSDDPSVISAALREAEAEPINHEVLRQAAARLRSGADPNAVIRWARLRGGVSTSIWVGFAITIASMRVLKAGLTPPSVPAGAAGIGFLTGGLLGLGRAAMHGLGHAAGAGLEAANVVRSQVADVATDVSAIRNAPAAAAAQVSDIAKEAADALTVAPEDIDQDMRWKDMMWKLLGGLTANGAGGGPADYPPPAIIAEPPPPMPQLPAPSSASGALTPPQPHTIGELFGAASAVAHGRGETDGGVLALPSDNVWQTGMVAPFGQPTGAIAGLPMPAADIDPVNSGILEGALRAALYAGGAGMLINIVRSAVENGESALSALQRWALRRAQHRR